MAFLNRAAVTLISTDPLAPGNVYSAGVTSDGTVGLYRVEVSIANGTGKLRLAGEIAGSMKSPCSVHLATFRQRRRRFGIARDVDTSDLHVEVIDLLGNRVEAEIGVAFLSPATLRCATSPREPCTAGAWRHERSRKYQAPAVIDRAASNRKGQRCETRSHTH